MNMIKKSSDDKKEIIEDMMDIINGEETERLNIEKIT